MKRYLTQEIAQFEVDSNTLANKFSEILFDKFKDFQVKAVCKNGSLSANFLRFVEEHLPEINQLNKKNHSSYFETNFGDFLTFEMRFLNETKDIYLERSIFIGYLENGFIKHPETNLSFWEVCHYDEIKRRLKKVDEATIALNKAIKESAHYFELYKI